MRNAGTKIVYDIKKKKKKTTDMTESILISLPYMPSYQYFWCSQNEITNFMYFSFSMLSAGITT